MVVDMLLLHDILLVVRLMKVSIPHCELKWEIPIMISSIVQIWSLTPAAIAGCHRLKGNYVLHDCHSKSSVRVLD